MMNALSYSDLQAFGRCPTRFKFRAIWGIQRKRTALAPKKGTVAHTLLKEFFVSLQSGSSFAAALETVLRTADLIIEEETNLMFTDEAEEFRAIVREMEEVVTRYVTQHEDQITGWEILHVEEQFMIQLESGAFITFTPDLVVRDRNGFVWIIDHKTTDRIPDGMPFADLQALVYYSGVKSLYPETAGFIFNYLRKKAPSEPRLAKTGNKRVAYLNTIDTTFEILRDFLDEEAPDLLDDPDHRQRLAELREKDNFFYQEQLYITPEQVTAALEDASNIHAAVMQAAETDVYYRVYLNRGAGYQSCDSCEFSSICRAELMNQNIELVLEEEYEDRDDSHKEYEEA